MLNIIFQLIIYVGEMGNKHIFVSARNDFRYLMARKMYIWTWLWDKRHIIISKLNISRVAAIFCNDAIFPLIFGCS